jgi:hypothetical protein
LAINLKIHKIKGTIMSNRSSIILLAAVTALSFTSLANVSYAGKTKQEKQIAKAERLLEKAKDAKSDAKAEKKLNKAGAIIDALEKHYGIGDGNNGGSGRGGDSVVDNPNCGGPGQPLC